MHCQNGLNLPSARVDPLAHFAATKLGIDLNEHLIKNPASTYFVRVNGDSMINAHIGNGAILIVDRSIEPQHGKIIIAIVF